MKNLFDALIGFQDESLEDYILELGFKENQKIDNYIFYRYRDTEIVYDSINKSIVDYKTK